MITYSYAGNDATYMIRSHNKNWTTSFSFKERRIYVSSEVLKLEKVMQKLSIVKYQSDWYSQEI